MEVFYSWPMIIGIIVCASIIYGIYHFLKKRKAKYQDSVTQDDEKEETYTSIDARVEDNTNRQLYNAVISKEDVEKIMETHKTLGRQWNKDGKYIYALKKTASHIYEPIIISSVSNNAPEKLHNDLQHPYLAITMNMQKKQDFMQKYGQILVWGAIMAFILFMFMSNK